MTIKEAILKSLEDLTNPITHKNIYENIRSMNYYNFGDAKTPEATISARLGGFIRNGDTRVKRIKGDGNYYLYYLSKNQDMLVLNENQNIKENVGVKNSNNYGERDLHLLFSTYLNSKNILNKTILHEQSNSNDGHQKWIHPDMIGIKFSSFKTDETQRLIRSLNSVDTFRLSSYELKKEIRTDYELKKSYFQAVSNSSWANYGYLVTFEINSSLMDEMERLNESFGIGIIELKANPFESKILFSSKYRELDFKTIDKLCNVNNDFKKYIELIEEILTADKKNIKRIKKELDKFSDETLNNEEEIKKYCLEKSIPFENEINE